MLYYIVYFSSAWYNIICTLIPLLQAAESHGFGCLKVLLRLQQVQRRETSSYAVQGLAFMVAPRNVYGIEHLCMARYRRPVLPRVVETVAALFRPFMTLI